jgi:hypothetical protein
MLAQTPIDQDDNKNRNDGHDWKYDIIAGREFLVVGLVTVIIVWLWICFTLLCQQIANWHIWCARATREAAPEFALSSETV